MSRFMMGALGLVLVTTFAMTVVACTEDPTEVGTGNLSDPATFEAVMRAGFEDGALGVVDGLERLFTALAGGTPDGVIITPTGGGAMAQIDIDFDGDGSRESVINGGVIGDLSFGAQLSVDNVAMPDNPGLVTSVFASVFETTPGVVSVNGLAGSILNDPPGEGNAAAASIAGGDVSLDIVTGVPTGQVFFSIVGEGSEIFGTLSFESDGSGGFRTRFSGDGFDFTVP